MIVPIKSPKITARECEAARGYCRAFGGWSLGTEPLSSSSLSWFVHGCIGIILVSVVRMRRHWAGDNQPNKTRGSHGTDAQVCPKGSSQWQYCSCWLATKNRCRSTVVRMCSELLYTQTGNSLRRAIDATTRTACIHQHLPAKTTRSDRRYELKRPYVQYVPWWVSQTCMALRENPKFP